MTGVDTGRRPAAASDGAPSSSASRKAVRKVTAATPSRVPGPRPVDASTLRAVTPTWLLGTTTPTGASGSPSLAAAMAARSRSSAGRP